MKLMIVEDDMRMQAVLLEMLAPLFADIDLSTDGGEAITAYLRTHPDLVVMDIRLPTMDGLEATERIIRRDPAARVFIVTAFDESPYRERAARIGAKGFFLKDDLGMLYNRLEQEAAPGM